MRVHTLRLLASAVCSPAKTMVSSAAGFVVAILVFGAVLVPQCRAQCSAHEITAVVLFDRLGTTPTLRLQRLHIRPVLSITNPSDEDLLVAVKSAFDNDPTYFFHRVATASYYHLYTSPPSDLGAAAIVDSRNGEVVFAGSVVWLGTGSLRIPLAATHEISTSPDAPAAPPNHIATMPAAEWYWEWPEPQQLTENAVALLRQTDLLRAFAACGDYEAVGFTYTPAIGAIVPDLASQVIIVSGHATSPWATTAIERITWSHVKGLFR